MYKFESVAQEIEEWIARGILGAGDQVPSVRRMSTKFGYSTVTVHQAYSYLMDKGVLESRPRSGFYVSRQNRVLPGFERSDMVKLKPANRRAAAAALMSRAQHLDLNQHLPGTGSVDMAQDLVATQNLRTIYKRQLRHELADRANLNVRTGNELKEALAKTLAHSGRRQSSDDLTIHPSFAYAMKFALDLADVEDKTVLVETPTNWDIVQTALERKANIVEIYSHPVYGVDPEQFEHIIREKKIDVFIITANNHCPTGITYPREVMRQIIEIAVKHNVLLIEDMSGYYLSKPGDTAEFSLFGMDEDVIRVGGFRDILGQEYALGWVSAGSKFSARVPVGAPYLPDVLGFPSLQKTIAEFITRRGFETYMRDTIASLSARTRRNMSSIFRTFPDGCTVSQPSVGYFCWVRGPKHFDAGKELRGLQQQGASFLPGTSFSVSGSFPNFFALNLSIENSDEFLTDATAIGEALSR